jgi:hypothetical protein
MKKPSHLSFKATRQSMFVEDLKPVVQEIRLKPAGESNVSFKQQQS